MPAEKTIHDMTREERAAKALEHLDAAAPYLARVFDEERAETVLDSFDHAHQQTKFVVQGLE